jgi:hypothetical protein
MNIQDVRRRALRAKLAEQTTTLNAFAKATGKSQSLLADVMRGAKGFGERLARDIERRAGWTDKLLDSEPGTGLSEPMIRHGLPISPDAVDMGREWDKICEPIRTHLLVLVRMLLDAQGDGDGRPKPRGKRREHRPDTRQ